MEQLLTTKLYIPPPRPELVPRPRLIELLNTGLYRKLTLISAPAGFGKTTMLSDWVGKINFPVAWLSLDKGDNDIKRFLQYFIAALQTIDTDVFETVQAMLQSPQSPPIESILTELVNEVASIEQNIILVLDDFHLIEASTVHDALNFLLSHLPPRVHLVITSRSDPLLQISILRAKDQVTELRADNLRFSIREATQFLNDVMGLALSADEVRSLEIRTEGWIAGLHLAALSMQSTDDVDGFISAFTGDDRYIVDYLVDEVLAQRPKGTKDFLLRTSILSRMSGPLCDAVAGQEGGQEMLERLDQANLFIVPLDNKRLWYRYHHLFAGLLRQRLEESADTQEINALHMRASQWFEEHDLLIEAVEHALAAEDYENVIQLIELGSMELLMQSQQSLLLRWQDELPPELITTYPRFCMTIAWAHLSIGHPGEAEKCLQRIEQSLGIETDDILLERERTKQLDLTVYSFLVEIAVMRMELAIEGGDIPQVFELSRLVLPHLEDDQTPLLDDHRKDLLYVVFFVLGLAYKISGKLSQAAESLSQAAVLGQERGNVHIIAGSTGRLANVQSMQGHLNQAVRTCQGGLELVQAIVGEHSPVPILLHAELGNLLYEKNDLEAALYHLQEGINVGRPWGFLEAFIPGYTGLARVRAAQRDWDGAFAALDELETLGEDNPAMVMPAVETLRALLSVAQGKVDAAYHWAMNAGLDPQGEINFQRIGELMVLARALIARGSLDDVVDLLTRMINTAEAEGWLGMVIEMRVLLAIALQGHGESDEALAVLEQVLNLAEPEGYVRVFIDEGDPLKALLREAETRVITPNYVPKLLAAFETDHVQIESPSIPSLIEPLSERELEVLRLLKTELSGPEIANELNIALSTMRTHTQNIYSKLGVSNRRAAVSKAEDLNLP